MQSTHRFGQGAGRTVVAGLVVALAMGLSATTVDAAGAKTRLISVKSNGKQANDGSQDGYASANGRFVAFASDAPNLVKNDTNDSTDIFVHDRQTGKTTRVSVKSNGKQANGPSRDPSISNNGRYVAFESSASNLVKNDFDSVDDIFVHDRVTGKTKRVNIRTQKGTVLGTLADSSDPEISGNGRYVVFASMTTFLVNGDDNDSSDVFIHDRKRNKTKLISKHTNGSIGGNTSKHPAISDDGRFVAFESFAVNLVPGDSNGDEDVFLRDRKKGTTTRVSVTSAGLQGEGESDDPDISGNGRFIGFETHALLTAGDVSSTRDVVIHDRLKKKTKLVSKSSSGERGDLPSGDIFLSFNGRWASFESAATNLISADGNGVTDVFVHDRTTKKTIRVNRRKGGGEPTVEADEARLSGDGRFVVFDSGDPKLVSNDSNGHVDVFRRGPLR